MLFALFLLLSTINFTIARKVFGVGIGGVNYWSHPVFADAMMQGKWLRIDQSSCSGWGCDLGELPEPQFNRSLSLPNSIPAGEKLRRVLFGLHSKYSERPSTWPDRTDHLLSGRWTLTWKGAADLQPMSCSYVAGSPSPENGVVTDGTRLYDCASPTEGLGAFVIESMTSPLTEIHAWMPDPQAPATSSLVDVLFHPTYLARLNDLGKDRIAWIRSMDLMITNNSPQKDWVDRRFPWSAVARGVLNGRNPAPEYQWSSGEQDTSVSWEHIVALANELDVGLYATVPHLATDDYITKLANLLLYGSDQAGEPYTSAQASPFYAPLKSTASLYLEYSNEIWSGGASFLQGEWAASAAANASISKRQFNGRRFCDVWRLFELVWSSAQDRARLKNVAATFTALESYSNEFFDEIDVYCPTLSPAPAVEAVAVTTYFGNDIQTFIVDNGYYNHYYTDGYWTSQQFDDEVNIVFDEWMRRILSGASAEGSGPDATGLTGGFPASLFYKALGYQAELIAYEGGPSLYSDDFDSGWGSNTAGLTTFLEYMNRQDRITEVLRAHLELAFSKGLDIHGIFVDVSSWGKYGQWGHQEFLASTANVTGAQKWQLALELHAEHSTLRSKSESIVTPINWTLSSDLVPELARFGNDSYVAHLDVTSAQTSFVKVIAMTNLDNMHIQCNCVEHPNEIRLIGTPSSNIGGFGYVLLRAQSPTGDAIWRIWKVKQYGHPKYIFEVDWTTAQDPALRASLPFTGALTLNNISPYTGLTIGSGFNALAGQGGIHLMSLSQPASQETLQEAISASRYISMSFTTSAAVDFRSATVVVEILRQNYHAPRRMALFFSVTGFSSGNQLADTGHFTNDNDPALFNLVLGTNSALNVAASQSIEIRFVFYEGQYANKEIALTDLSIALDGVTFTPPAQFDIAAANAAWCPGGFESTAPTTTSTATSSTTVSGGMSPSGGNNPSGNDGDDLVDEPSEDGVLSTAVVVTLIVVGALCTLGFIAAIFFLTKKHRERMALSGGTREFRRRSKGLRESSQQRHSRSTGSNRNSNRNSAALRFGDTTASSFGAPPTYGSAPPNATSSGNSQYGDFGHY